MRRVQRRNPWSGTLRKNGPARSSDGRAARLRRRALSAARALLIASGIAIGVFFVLDRVFPFPIENLERPPALVIADRTGAPLRIYLSPDEKLRMPVRLDEVDPALRDALVTSEDRWFWIHPGVNPLAIGRAALANAANLRIVSGGSTITMQLARMAEPKRRTLGAKVRESFRALQLEMRFSKARLLEMYLNAIPCGGNIEGVGAASYAYFGKTPSHLSLGEAALIASLPRAPTRFDPVRHPDASRAARRRVLDALVTRGVVGTAAAEAASLQPIPAKRRRPPLLAPHFCQLARTLSAGEAGRIATTLDPNAQHAAERQVAARIGGLRADGVGNAAVVVLANDGREVRALVGSADFFDRAASGQVDGTVARRSPGSALKPFLYATAFDDGLLVPDSFVLDVPTDFAGYVPENYDGTYSGQVTAREALVRSLNAPAVRLLSDVGVDRFHAALARGGITTLDQPASHYGLSLVLGSGEVSLLELTNLYVSLAQGGVAEPVRMTAGAEGAGTGAASPSGARLWSREAAALVTEVMTEIHRPDMPASWDRARGAPAVAWKTGTSFGHRDAWAIGFSRRYTIGVWVGNFDGTAVEGIAGATHAAPLLFDLFRALDPGGSPPTRPAGLDIGTIEVCAASHELPEPFCPKRIAMEYLPGRTVLRRCTVHRQALTDPVSGAVLDAGRAAPHGARRALVAIEPAELAAWRRAPERRAPDRGAPENSAREQARGAIAPMQRRGAVALAPAPRITSPDPATPYLIRHSAPLADQRIPLTAVASGDGPLSWFQDGVLVASASPAAQTFVDPAPGSHRLVVVDSAGRTCAITYRVE